ncbi:protein bicaudal D homolog 2-like isoform X3 [Apostichopus japonicus]|uniref:protein bicaudal D homolog 2-like isoform X3 n=1 Tax=Stichopus japonicus TaxID=307972 RepID=UPI003AB41195
MDILMSDSEDGLETIDELRVKIARLKDELAQASREKVQAAEYGLAVLDEKQQLKQQNEEMEILFETAKQELQMAKEALDHQHQWQRKHTEQEVSHEQNLLQETASREAELTKRLGDVEQDLKVKLQELNHVKIENSKIHSRHVELTSSFEKMESEKKILKDELRDIKFRESRMMRDYSELEEENTTMQKHISSLKSSQIEYESLKHENRRLTEEIQYLNSNIDDQVRLREITEKQIEETLQALESEREQKHQLKKQIDQAMLMELEAINNDLENNTSLVEVEEDEFDGESPPAHPLLQQMEYEMQADEEGNSHRDLNRTGSLYSEIHSTEIKKLEEQLAQLETEKSELSKTLEMSQSELESTKGVLQSLGDLPIENGEVEGEVEEAIPPNLNETQQKLYQLVRLVKQYEKKYATAMAEINSLKSEMMAQGNRNRDDNTKKEAQSGIINEQNRKHQDTIKDLKGQLKQLSDLVGETQGHLNCTQDELVNISEDVGQLYTNMCLVNSESPNKKMQEHLKLARQSRRENFTHEFSSRLKEVTTENGIDGTKSSSAQISHGLVSKLHGNPVTCSNLLLAIRDQVKFLKRAVEQAAEMSRQRGKERNETETEDLKEEVVKLKLLLQTKREQVATLRTVLKANKTTAEVALANLKGKYENEKYIIADTLTKLRTELKALKEDAATFSSLRAMFAKRCDEYVTQLEEMHRQIAAADEEKKTLNSLLRMAIQQKLALTQRLEDLECHQESQMVPHRQPRHPRRHKPAKVHVIE